MARQLLTDAHLRGIKTNDTRKRLSDGGGLYLLLSVKGGSHGWRLDYTHDGKRKTLSLGTYPDTGLGLARKKADEARALRRLGFDGDEMTAHGFRAMARTMLSERLVLRHTSIDG